MTPRSLALATKALEGAGSREIPLAVARVYKVGHNRRVLLGVMFAVLTMTVLTNVLSLSSESFVRLIAMQFAMALLLGVIFVPIAVRTQRGDDMLAGGRLGLLVVTASGLRLFATPWRRPPVVQLALTLDDLAFAHVEPRRMVLDLPRFVFGHIAGTLAFEISGRDVVQLRRAIQLLEEAQDAQR